MTEFNMFRKLSPQDRLKVLERIGVFDDESRELLGSETAFILADILVESTIGCMPVPLGIATGFSIDGRIVHIPMATEEASVVQAAGYAGTVIARYGGITTHYEVQPLMGQIVFQNLSPEERKNVQSAEVRLVTLLQEETASLKKHGGGYSGHRLRTVAGYSSIDVFIGVGDAMGANIMNHMLEKVRTSLEALLKRKALCAILSNYQEAANCTSRFSIPFAALARGGRAGEDVAARIVAMSSLAEHDIYRATTHNKGIMNGIQALALATGNDTRAIDAQVHAFAARSGLYSGLGNYTIVGQHLVGELHLPLHFATTGGACTIHPVAMLSLRILEHGWGAGLSSAVLSRIAVATGLAQNFAALFALVSEGIQSGHMKQHYRRMAWQVGARGDALYTLYEHIKEKKPFGLEAVRSLYTRLKNNTIDT